MFDTLSRVGTWHDPDLGRPIAAPLQQCAELLGVDLATIRAAAANIEPYLRADGTRIWSLMQLERQLRPEAYGRRRGGYLDRRRTQEHLQLRDQAGSDRRTSNSSPPVQRRPSSSMSAAKRLMLVRGYPYGTT